LHGPASLTTALANPTILYFGLVYFLIQMGVSVVVFYLPTFVGKLLGAAPGPLVGLVVAIPWTCALIATFVVPRLATQRRRLALFGAASMIVAAIAMVASTGSSPLITVVAMCLAVAGLWAVQPIFWTMLTNYVGGIASVLGIALVGTIGNIGNFVSPNVKTWADGRFGTGVGGLLVLSAVVLLGGILIALLHRSTRSKATFEGTGPTDSEIDGTHERIKNA
jgi:predicted MFS family arabinose efflux permease